MALYFQAVLKFHRAPPWGRQCFRQAGWGYRSQEWQNLTAAIPKDRWKRTHLQRESCAFPQDTTRGHWQPCPQCHRCQSPWAPFHSSSYKYLIANTIDSVGQQLASHSGWHNPLCVRMRPVTSNGSVQLVFAKFLRILEDVQYTDCYAKVPHKMTLCIY